MRGSTEDRDGAEVRVGDSVVFCRRDYSTIISHSVLQKGRVIAVADFDGKRPKSVPGYALVKWKGQEWGNPAWLKSSEFSRTCRQ